MNFAKPLNVCGKCATIRYLRPPVVANGSLTVGPSGAVSFQIIATNTPTSYGATGLPTGLSLNTSTGVISGNVPATLTTYSIPISATNAAGTGHGTLTLIVKSPITFRFQNLSTTGQPQSFQVAIDGGSYSNVTFTGGLSPTFSASSQVKYKSSLLPYTSQDQGLEILGSVMSGSCTIISGTRTSNGNITASAFGTNLKNWLGSSSTVDFAPDGTYSFSHDLSGLVLSTGNTMLHEYDFQSNPQTVISGIMETIFNF